MFENRIATSLQKVPGVVAVVLGGSRATGSSVATSDYDIGVYYHADTLDMAALQRVATALDDAGRHDLVAAPGGWGAWVNGGAWITVEGHRVDIILRDIDRVTTACAAAVAGRFGVYYQPGHPHGFLDIMYAGEVAHAAVRWQHADCITLLKDQVTPYPPALRDALMGFFRFEAGFSHQMATSSALTDDAFYTHAHITRSLAALHQVLFAHNRTYCLNEKRAVARIDALPARPDGYRQAVTDICTQPELRVAVTQLGRLIAAVELLVDPPSPVG